MWGSIRSRFPWAVPSTGPALLFSTGATAESTCQVTYSKTESNAAIRVRGTNKLAGCRYGARIECPPQLCEHLSVCMR